MTNLINKWLLSINEDYKTFVKYFEMWSKDEFTFYFKMTPTGKKEWWWKRESPNGNIVGASTEGYARLTASKLNARRNGYMANIHKTIVLKK